ncbi:MAG: hypothetical protein GY822_08805 [Deltaproteobacteria bacterium]|nr:hypothetical protein [Deltaproteobacteria bacterium]
MSDFDQATMLAAARIVLAAGGGGTQVTTTPQPVAKTPLEIMAEVKEILPQLKEFLPYLDMLKSTPAEQAQASKAEEKIHTDDMHSEEEPVPESIDVDDPALMPKLMAQLSEQVAEMAMAQYDAHKAFVQRFDDLDDRFNRLVGGLQMMIQPPEETEKEESIIESEEELEPHVNGEERNLTEAANGSAI